MKRTKMNKTIYKQLDRRWSSLPYPGKGYTVGGCGCGLVACTHIAIEQKNKASWTPKTLRPWMVRQGFAICGQGTTWNGITQTLLHIGHKKVVHIGQADPMSKAFAELDKGNRIGVILFRSGKAPNGKVWTGSGHYVAFSGYRIGKKTGRHYFYCKDSGPRNNDGWKSYEKSMKGLVSQMWIVERIPERTWKDNANDWARKTAKDNSYHYVKWSKDKRTHECPICHDHPKGEFHGWNCIGFAFAIWHHGGGLKNRCNCGVVANDTWERILHAKTLEEASKIATDAVGIPCKVIRNGGKPIATSKFKQGDICAIFNGSTYLHTYYYMGGEYIADSSRGYDDQIAVRKKFANYAKSTKLIIRYAGGD